MRRRLPRLLVHLAAVAAAVAIAVLLVRWALATGLAAALRDGRGDCIINWLGARAWRAGIDVYSPSGLAWAGIPVFGHPPTTPLWYLPLTRYGIFDLTTLWGYGLIAILLVHLVVVAFELRFPTPLACGVVAWALVMATSWWAYHVAMVQLSEPIAFLYVLAWVALRRNHDAAAGVLLGLACSMKLYAGLVVLALVVGRRWRGVAVAIATYLVFVVAATLRFGWRCWIEYLPMLRSTQNQWIPNPHNASLDGIVVRTWLAATHERAAALTHGTIVASVVAIAIVAALAWLSRRALLRKPGVAVDAAVDLPIAAFSTASVWLNPVVWEHYDATLLLPLAVVAASLWRARGRVPWAWLAVGATLLVAVVWMLSFNIGAKNAPAHAAWYITANWLPWPLTLAVCGLLLWSDQRASSA